MTFVNIAKADAPAILIDKDKVNLVQTKGDTSVVFYDGKYFRDFNDTEATSANIIGALQRAGTDMLALEHHDYNDSEKITSTFYVSPEALVSVSISPTREDAYFHAKIAVNGSGTFHNMKIDSETLKQLQAAFAKAQPAALHIDARDTAYYGHGESMACNPELIYRLNIIGGDTVQICFKDGGIEVFSPANAQMTDEQSKAPVDDFYSLVKKMREQSALDLYTKILSSAPQLVDFATATGRDAIAPNRVSFFINSDQVIPHSIFTLFNVNNNAESMHLAFNTAAQRDKAILRLQASQKTSPAAQKLKK